MVLNGCRPAIAASMARGGTETAPVAKDPSVTTANATTNSTTEAAGLMTNARLRAMVEGRAVAISSAKIRLQS
jgi:hypothetical protein